MHAWHAAPPTYRPTEGLLFIMLAPRPATSPSEASPLLHCATVQLTWTQEDLGLLGWTGPPKMQAGVHIVLALALQVTEIARSFVSYMTSKYLS